MKSYFLIITILVLGLPWQVNSSQDITDVELPIWATPQLTELIKEGLIHNQDLQSIELKIKSFKEEAPAAGSLNDPRIGIGLLNVPTDTFSLSQEPMTQKQIFIAQKVPWFGKLDLKSKKVFLMADREKALLEVRRISLAKQIAITYYQFSITDVSLKINHRLMQMVKQLIKVSETRYKSGKGIQPDVLQAHVELSNLIDEKITLRKKRGIIENRMNELLNRETFSPITLQESLEEPHLNIDVARLQNLALRKSPFLAVKQAEIDQAVVGIKLADKEYWPDMDFKVAYGQRSENAAGQGLSDFLSASAMMNIPLWQKNRQDKKAAASRSRRQAALKAYKSYKLRLPYKVDALVMEIESITENYHLYRDALTIQARQWAQSSMAAYQVGKVEFNTMIKAQIRLLRFELKTATYLHSIYQKRAELEELIGGPLPENL